MLSVEHLPRETAFGLLFWFRISDYMVPTNSTQMNCKFILLKLNMNLETVGVRLGEAPEIFNSNSISTFKSRLESYLFVVKRALFLILFFLDFLGIYYY